MLDINRQGRGGNLIERSGPVLRVDFGDGVVGAIFKGLRLTYRYMELRRPLYGFAPEDKFHVVPVGAEEFLRGLKRHIDIWTDPGGDITLELSEKAGLGRKYGDNTPFLVEEVSSNPAGLLERGIDTVILPGLFAIEAERQGRLLWGRSSLDPDWRPTEC